MKQVEEARTKMRAACTKLEEANAKLLAIVGPPQEPLEQPTPLTFARAAKQRLGEVTARLDRLIGA